MAGLRIALLLSFVICPIAWAQSPAIDGNWQGALAPTLRVGLQVSRTATGDVTATFEVVDQAKTGIAVQQLVFSRNSLTFEVAALNASFAGTLATDGSQIEGTMTETLATGRRVARPLVFRRVGTIQTLARPQTPQEPFPYTSTAVVYDGASAEVRLGGTLTLPAAPIPSPAILLISGSGAQDRDGALAGHKPMWVIADDLTRHGIAVLRVDDRGVGASTGTYASTTVDDMAADALAGVAYLRRRPEIDPTRIGLLGHSAGGRLAALAASRSRDVAFVVMLAGTGVSIEQTIVSQRAAVLRLWGATEEAIARDRLIVAMVLRVLKGGPDGPGDRDAVKREWERIKAGLQGTERTQADAADAYVERLASEFSIREIQSDLGRDPADALRQIRVPVLAVSGSRDLQVLPGQHLPAIASALAASENPDFALVSLPGLNHLLQECQRCTVDEYSKLDETLAPAALKAVADWVVRHTQR